MSEPTNAEIAVEEDKALDAQIAEHEQEKYEQRMRDEAAIPDDTEPDRELPEEFGTYASDGFRLTTVLSGDITPGPFAGAQPKPEVESTRFGVLMAALFPKAAAYWLGQLVSEFSSKVDSDGKSWWAGSWYVITVEGDILLCGSEDEATDICANRGIVWTHGYAKHLIRGYE